MSEPPVIHVKPSANFKSAINEDDLPSILAEMGFDVTTALADGAYVHTYSFPLLDTNETVSPDWQWPQGPTPQDD